jgi:ribosomal protein L27
VQSLTGILIQMFEVQVISSGLNVAIGKDATQSSDFKGKVMFAASKAVDDNKNSFLHTGSSECGVWWEVDLGD